VSQRYDRANGPESIGSKMRNRPRGGRPGRGKVPRGTRPRSCRCRSGPSYVGPETDLGDLFLFEAKRKVQKDRTVSLEGYAYEVDATLVGETVTLRYDPARLGRPIQIWHDDHHVHDAKVVDAKSNCFVKRSRPPAPPPTTGLSLTGFERDEEEDR